MKNKNPYKWTFVPRVRHEVKKSMNCLRIIIDPKEMEKINYYGMKVIRTKSFASQLHGPPPTVGKIQSSRMPDSSLASSALTPW